jgi:tetratricopeptide (TPR) repeat protein
MRAVLPIALVAAALVAGPARAEPARDEVAEATERKVAEAKRLAARAQTHFDLGEYAEAIAVYRQAYRLHSSPGFLYNLGQAYRLAGDCANATMMYRNYLRLAPRSPYRALVQRHLSSLDGCPGTGAAASGSALLGAPADRRTDRLAALEPVVAEAGAGLRARSGRAKQRIGLVSGGAGLGLLGAGVAFAVHADRAEDQVTRLYLSGASWRRIAEADAAGRRSEAIGVSLLVGGGAAVVTGAAFYWMGWRDERRTRVVIAPAPTGGQVAVSWEL